MARLSNSIYRNTYFEIYHLVAHTKNRSTSDLFRRSIMSVLLVKCLNAAGYFGQRVSREESNDIVCVGSHLLRMLQVLPCNAHEISEFMQIDKDLVNSHTIEIAAAIYATFSLFNHCCDPYVTRNFYGDTCVMRSIQTIPKGDEVLDNYGYVSAVTPLEERQTEAEETVLLLLLVPGLCRRLAIVRGIRITGTNLEVQALQSTRSLRRTVCVSMLVLQRRDECSSEVQ